MKKDRLYRRRSGGFTLLELLVVIAIIGILSSVVIESLISAKQRAYDAKVKSQLVNLRNAAELYYLANGSYGATTTNCTSGMFTDTTSGLSKLSVSANYPTGQNTIVCNANSKMYAVGDNLSIAGTYWCIDSNGTSKQESAPLSTSTSVINLCQ